MHVCITYVYMYVYSNDIHKIERIVLYGGNLSSVQISVGFDQDDCIRRGFPEYLEDFQVMQQIFGDREKKNEKNIKIKRSGSRIEKGL